MGRRKKKCEEKEEKVVPKSTHNPNVFDYEIRIDPGKLWWAIAPFNDPNTGFKILNGPGYAKPLPEKMSEGLVDAINTGRLLPVEPKIIVVKKEKTTKNGC